MKKITGNIKYDLALATILVLTGVLAVQNFPDLPQNVEAFTAPTEVTMADQLGEEIDRKTVEKYIENYTNNMREARTQVLIEEQMKLNQYANEIPTETYDYLKQSLDAMENGQ